MGKISDHLDDAMIALGCVFVLFWVSQVHPVDVPLVAGVMLIILGVAVGAGAKPK
jgi:hypothetical protein